MSYAGGPSPHPEAPSPYASDLSIRQSPSANQIRPSVSGQSGNYSNQYSPAVLEYPVGTPSSFPPYLPNATNPSTSQIPGAPTPTNRSQDSPSEFPASLGTPTATAGSTRPQLQLGKMPPPFVPPPPLPPTPGSQPLNRKGSNNSTTAATPTANPANYIVGTPQIATPPVANGTPTSKRKRDTADAQTKKVRTEKFSSLSSLYK